MASVPDLLNRIRNRPGLYLGEPSLTALYYTMSGYELALGTHGITSDISLQLPADFHDWVAYRLHFRESTSGWRKMILSASQDEEAAFHRFFKLLDEHAARKGRVIAKLTDFHRTYTVGCEGHEVSKRYPTTVSLIAYTDDPGFFVVSDEPGVPMPREEFYPSLDWFETFMDVPRSALTILDLQTYQRWTATSEPE